MLRLHLVRIDEWVLVRTTRCPRHRDVEECGAQLKLGPDSCPLCGAELTGDPGGKEKSPDAETYQSNVRDLREELRRLRNHDAEAV